VGVEVGHFGRRDGGIGQGLAQRCRHRPTRRVRGREMMRVGGEAVAGKACEDGRRMGFGCGAGLQDEGAGPFAEDEAPAVGIEGPAAVRVHRAQGVEPGVGEAA